jgi:hypothetical protein
MASTSQQIERRLLPWFSLLSLSGFGVLASLVILAAKGLDITPARKIVMNYVAAA